MSARPTSRNAETELGGKLEDIKVELEQEKEKCLLLMYYPSLNGADPNYMEYLSSLEYFEMQNHLAICQHDQNYVTGGPE